MNKQQFTLIEIIGFGLIVAVVGITLGLSWGVALGHTDWRSAAIQNGAATYRITNQQTGQTALFWTETGKETP